jgi:hypothetical protein
MSTKRDWDEDEEEDEDDNDCHQHPKSWQRQLLPSETSLSTHTSFGEVLVGQSECQIKFGNWFVQNRRGTLEGPFQAGYDQTIKL